MLETATGSFIERSAGRIVILLSVIVLGLVLAFCFFASSICITILASAFIAILVDPVVVRLESLHLGRALSSGLVILSGVLIVGILANVSYQKARDFSDELPAYSGRINNVLKPVIAKFERVRKNAAAIAPPDVTPRARQVEVKQAPNWPSFFFRGVGSLSSTLVVIGVVPFLTFFMLLKKDHMHRRFVATCERHLDVHVFLHQLNHMVRGFVLGTLIVGAIMAGATSITFLLLGFSNAVVLGVVTAVLNLIPFLGLVLAVALSGAAALVQFKTVGVFVVAGLVVIILHLIAANFLVPRLIGSRVSLGPVAATVGILFWGWLWGIFGLLLAVPLTAFVKLIADTQPALASLSDLLAEKPQLQPAGQGTLRSYLAVVQRVWRRPA